ncbi:MAG: hypothetical protein LBV36_05355 [Chromatiales bacterium]|jgi:hypothetical protein|nr:hypothetical protein [Chromatiales bacterium]
MSVYSVDKLICEARRLAAAYRDTTGRPLAGVSGEISRYDAARLLDLDLCTGESGFDAIGRSGERVGRRIQIKARAIFDTGKSGQRIGQLKVDQTWDSIMLVLLDERFEAFAIYEATRDALAGELDRAVDSRRAKRGVMSVGRFKALGQLVWAREGAVDDGVWSNQAAIAVDGATIAGIGSER